MTTRTTTRTRTMKPPLLIILVSSLGQLGGPAAQPATNQLAALVQSAHDPATRSTVADKTISQRDAAHTILVNKHVLVRLSATNALWDAAWPETPDTAILHAGFAIEWNGKIVRLDPSPIAVRPFTNQLGSGLEARQTSGDTVQIERLLRVYDGKPALVLSASIVNHSSQEISLGTARLVHLFQEDGGAWQVGNAAETPAAVHAVSGAHWFSTPWEPGKNEQTYNSAEIGRAHV